MKWVIAHIVRKLFVSEVGTQCHVTHPSTTWTNEFELFENLRENASHGVTRRSGREKLLQCTTITPPLHRTT